MDITWIAWIILLVLSAYLARKKILTFRVFLTGFIGPDIVFLVRLPLLYLVQLTCNELFNSSFSYIIDTSIKNILGFIYFYLAYKIFNRSKERWQDSLALTVSFSIATLSTDESMNLIVFLVWLNKTTYLIGLSNIALLAVKKKSPQYFILGIIANILFISISRLLFATTIYGYFIFLTTLILFLIFSIILVWMTKNKLDKLIKDKEESL